MKIHFLTFASSAFKKSLMRIGEEARQTHFFDNVTCLNEKDLVLSYRIKNIFFLNSFTRGYGYWIWKSYVTKLMLEKIDYGDVLLYVDAGSVLNMQGKKRFDEYIEMLNGSEFSNLSFQMGFLEKEYTKGDLFKYFGVENDVTIKNSGMLVGGVFFLKKDDRSIALIDEWYSVCHNNKNLITDAKSKFPNDKKFVEHRHDQSVFSLLRKIKGSLIIKDETYFHSWDENKRFPIHTRRLR